MIGLTNLKKIDSQAASNIANYNAYRSFYPHAGLLLAVTEDVTSRVIVLSTGSAIGPAENNRFWGIINNNAFADTPAEACLSRPHPRVHSI